MENGGEPQLRFPEMDEKNNGWSLKEKNENHMVSG
jgi:hypothetical protein